MESAGGDSAARYANTTRGMPAWRRTLRRCSFVCCDAFDLLKTVKDQAGCGLYVDSPWAGEPGEKYTHPFVEAQHRKLATALSRFKHTRVVVRYGVHPLVEELYPRGGLGMVDPRGPGSGESEEGGSVDRQESGLTLIQRMRGNADLAEKVMEEAGTWEDVT